MRFRTPATRHGISATRASGTVIVLMIPYALVLTVAWTLFFVAWYAIGIPLGPGRPFR
jgi:p-aminobenzoyl-glutamate transporter AbgT